MLTARRLVVKIVGCVWANAQLHTVVINTVTQDVTAHISSPRVAVN